MEELHLWHVQHSDAHPLFRRLQEEQTSVDPAVALMLRVTEEGQKVARLGGKKFFAVYERIAEAELAEAPLSIMRLWTPR